VRAEGADVETIATMRVGECAHLLTVRIATVMLFASYLSHDRASLRNSLVG
jgi:hypothetical protein